MMKYRILQRVNIPTFHFQEKAIENLYLGQVILPPELRKMPSSLANQVLVILPSI
jgi:hypothetical protein